MRAEWERIGRGEEISASSGMPLCNPTRRRRERKREKEKEKRGHLTSGVKVK